MFISTKFNLRLFRNCSLFRTSKSCARLLWSWEFRNFECMCCGYVIINYEHIGLVFNLINSTRFNIILGINEIIPHEFSSCSCLEIDRNKEISISKYTLPLGRTEVIRMASTEQDSANQVWNGMSTLRSGGNSLRMRIGAKFIHYN